MLHFVVASGVSIVKPHRARRFTKTDTAPLKQSQTDVYRKDYVITHVVYDNERCTLLLLETLY